MQPTTHYAKSGDIHVAYQVFGEAQSMRFSLWTRRLPACWERRRL